jgi:hypothetical protein
MTCEGVESINDHYFVYILERLSQVYTCSLLLPLYMDRGEERVGMRKAESHLFTGSKWSGIMREDLKLFGH